MWDSLPFASCNWMLHSDLGLSLEHVPCILVAKPLASKIFKATSPLLAFFGAVCLDVRTLAFCQLIGFPLNH